MPLKRRLRTERSEILDREGLSERGLAILADLERLSDLYGWTRHHRRAVEAFWVSLGRPVPFRILDIGTGTGWLLEVLAAWAVDRGIEVELTGVEISADFAEKARERLGDDARIVHADARTFDPDERWHLTVSTLAMHHLPRESRREFVRTMDRLGDAVYLFDLELALVPLVTSPLMRLLGAGRDTVSDGILSVRRANTHREFRRLVRPHGGRARRVFPAAQSTWPAP